MMRVKYFIIILSLSLCFSLEAQINSNYNRGFEKGFKEGYCYNNSTYDCLTPMTPLVPQPRLNESNESYTDGYNRGFQFGLDLRRSKDAMSNSDNSLSRIPKFNNYVSQNPVEAMRVVGMYKQQKFDLRKDWIQQRIYQLSDLIQRLFNKDNLPGIAIKETRNIYIVKLTNYANSISAVDFSEDYQFSSIVRGFNAIENDFYSSFNSCLEHENKISDNKVYEKTNLEVNNNSLSPDFVNFLNRNEGNYNCAIFSYELLSNEYKHKETMNGWLKISGLRIEFKNKDDEWKFRNIIGSSIDEKSNDYICKTEDGDLRINRNWNKITFYNIGDNTCYVYIPLHKSQNTEEESKKIKAQSSQASKRKESIKKK